MIRSNGLSRFLCLAAILAWGLLFQPALSQEPDPAELNHRGAESTEAHGDQDCAVSSLCPLCLCAETPRDSQPEPPPTASRWLVRIDYQNRDDLATLAGQGWDIWEVHADYAVAAIPSALLSQTALTGLTVTDLGPVRPFNSFDPAYHTYTEMLAELQAVAAAHPDIVRLYDIGDGWEKTVGRADRDLWAVQITRFPTDTGHQRMDSQDLSAGVYHPLETTRPRVLFVAAHHAREIATTEVALQLLSLLVNGYGQDAEITYLVDQRETWIVPMINPDGHARVETVYTYWRKNANDTYGYCGGIFGIDLNRNFEYQWGGASTDPCSETFQGTFAFSEPENQALKQLMEAHNFALALSYHSYGRYVLYPWGYMDTAPPNASLMSAISSKMASYNGYTAGQASTTLYSLTGDLCDWAYGVRNIPCLVVEMGYQFDPPQSALPGLWAENRPGALYLLKIADDPTRAYGPEATAAAVVTWAGGFTLTATLSDAANGGQIVTAAEYFVDTLGANGSGAPMQPADGAWSASQEAVVAALPALSPGRHTLFVRGRDAVGNWGTLAATFWDVPWRYYLPIMFRD